MHSRFAQCHWNTKESQFCALLPGPFSMVFTHMGLGISWWQCSLFPLENRKAVGCPVLFQCSGFQRLGPPSVPHSNLQGIFQLAMFDDRRVYINSRKKQVAKKSSPMLERTSSLWHGDIGWFFWKSDTGKDSFKLRSTATHDNYVSPKKQAALACWSWKPHFIPFPGPSSRSSAWSLTVCPFWASIERPTLPWIASVECQPSSWLAPWRWWKRGGSSAIGLARYHWSQFFCSVSAGGVHF